MTGTREKKTSLRSGCHPHLRIIGVADCPDIDPDLRAYNQHWAGQLGVPYSEDLDESIDDPAIDIVSLGCELERRSALIVRAAEASKHLWIDKFPGATLAESEASAVPCTLFRIAGNDDCDLAPLTWAIAL